MKTTAVNSNKEQADKQQVEGVVVVVAHVMSSLYS